MSKKSCEAAERFEAALLRMARVNWQQYLLNAQCGNSEFVTYATCRTRPKGALLRLDHNQFFRIQSTLHHFINAVL